MDCHQIEARLADCLGGELDPARRRQVEEHLSVCAACRQEVEGLARTVQDLAALPAVSPGQAVAMTAGLEIRRRRPWPRRLLAAGLRYAAVLLVGAAVGWALKATDRRPAPPPGPPAEAPGPSPAAVNPAWLDLARRSARLHEGRSSFVRQLALLGAAGRQGHP